MYADVEFDTWLPAEDVMDIDLLKRGVPEVTWDGLQAGGVLLGEPVADRLERLWGEHLRTVSPEEPLIPEEIHPDETFPEGGATSIVVNRYERDPRARQACIDKWGYSCAVCNFSFEARYGELGKNYIHVHHLKDLSTLGGEYDVDPVKDLRPVCPNCHAMLHRAGRPAMESKKLRVRLRPM
ncbi:MAG: HNH endonuclease [Acidimicrobiales bacterium]|jgi:5-methylcytosine-specific restriction protein A